MRKIVIIGATGMLGKPVTKEFIKAGFQVTALVRDVEKAKKFFDANIQIVHGNLQDRKELEGVLKGKDGLYLNLSVEQNSGKSDFQPEREGLENVLEVAKELNIKRIGYLSSLVHLYQGQNGFDWWVFDIKQKAVEKIKKSGIKYSIFYPSTFMESFDKGAYRQGNNIALAGFSKHKMFLIAGEDYGKQVVNAFKLDQGNNDYVIQGNEGFTADEAATFYVNHYKRRKVRILKAPLGMLHFMGLFIRKFNYGAKIVEALNNYPEKFEAEKTWQELGRPEIKFIDYIQQSES
jgi:uncharacterized protein YbjT (DUF2867 family)